MTEVGNRNIQPLPELGCARYGRYTYATNDLLPGMDQAKFQAIASTLIYGKQDAVLVDAFMTVKQDDLLVDWIAASGKNLTTIYITHGHGDHWFGIGAFLNASQMQEQLQQRLAVVKAMQTQIDPNFIDLALLNLSQL